MPTMVVTAERLKPRLRGVLHELGFYAALGVGSAVVLAAHGGRAFASAVVFCGSVAACFGASALYHRPTWRPNVRAWLARVDHAGLYLLIAGTYTPFGLLVMSAGWAVPVLAVVWGGALAAIVLKLVWFRAPKWLSAVFGLALGWVGAVAFTQLLKLQAPGLALVIAGGLLYTAGALVYAFKRPDPIPHIFGYHELFHALTLGAVACHYAAIAFFVLPRG
jgi:hemolysin III